jgi:light-regulated signal transduction histidine kinase (bacteriophytochrome)
MHELFRHLLDNAVKFRADRPLAIDVGARRDGDGWSIWVRDNGIGIEPLYHEKVFAIFQRLHTRAAYPGNGIGLAICKKIVEIHGGRIWIESDGQAGTGVVFRLPDRAAPEPSAALTV